MEEQYFANSLKKGKEYIKLFIDNYPDSTFRQVALHIYFSQTTEIEDKTYVYENAAENSELKLIAKSSLINANLEELFEYSNERSITYREDKFKYQFLFDEMLERDFSAREIWLLFRLTNNERRTKLYNKIKSESNTIEDIAYYSCAIESKYNNPLSDEQKAELFLLLSRNGEKKVNTINDIVKLSKSIELYDTEKSRFIQHCHPKIERIFKRDVQKYDDVRSIKEELLRKVITITVATHLLGLCKNIDDFHHFANIINDPDYGKYKEKRYSYNAKASLYIEKSDFVFLEKKFKQNIHDFLQGSSLEMLIEFAKKIPFVTEKIEEVAQTEEHHKRVYKELDYLTKRKIKPKEEAKTIDDLLQRCLDDESKWKECGHAIALAQNIEDLYYIFDNGRYSYRNQVLRLIFEKAEKEEDILFVYQNSLGHGKNYNWTPDDTLRLNSWNKAIDLYHYSDKVKELLDNPPIESWLGQEKLFLKTYEGNLSVEELCNIHNQLKDAQKQNKVFEKIFYLLNSRDDYRKAITTLNIGNYRSILCVNMYFLSTTIDDFILISNNISTVYDKYDWRPNKNAIPLSELIGDCFGNNELLFGQFLKELNSNLLNLPKALKTSILDIHSLIEEKIFSIVTTIHDEIFIYNNIENNDIKQQYEEKFLAKTSQEEISEIIKEIKLSNDDKKKRIKFFEILLSQSPTIENLKETYQAIDRFILIHYHSTAYELFIELLENNGIEGYKLLYDVMENDYEKRNKYLSLILKSDNCMLEDVIFVLDKYNYEHEETVNYLFEKYLSIKTYLYYREKGWYRYKFSTEQIRKWINGTNNSKILRFLIGDLCSKLKYHYDNIDSKIEEILSALKIYLKVSTSFDDLKFIVESLDDIKYYKETFEFRNTLFNIMVEYCQGIEDVVYLFSKLSLEEKIKYRDILIKKALD